MRTMDTSTSINLVRFNQLPQRCMLNEYWISVGVATRRWRHYIFSSHFPSVDHRVLSVGRSIVSFTYTNGAHVTPYQEGNESQRTHTGIMMIYNNMIFRISHPFVSNIMANQTYSDTPTRCTHPTQRIGVSGMLRE
ncbi:hypothetical protein PTI98_008719 [Pleurotus ostreatus]|nr:hypothetical protein PTI98_008719 [Pleurotus ostreatus]